MSTNHLVEPKEVIHNAIKRHAGLSDWDDEGIAAEVKAILRALKNNGYKIVPGCAGSQRLRFPSFPR